ncbi:t-SNARE domain-containing protein 1 [Elysia marginata]|uniref:t-SNARE domain-containing protein 1 n=1 Tax=Elysia marginata TaxID=1093978 RepID=A0AAV4IHD8_9GAST|nr:t-SNARE domain-containing protein 1 [Elysia marginata]
MGKNSKRKSVRFTSVEIVKLLELVGFYKNIIMDRLKLKTSIQNKKLCWASIAIEVSKANPMTPERSGEQCSIKFRDMKSDCRLFRKSLSKTGGGPKLQEPPFYHTICDLLGSDSVFWEGIKDSPCSSAIHLLPTEYQKKEEDFHTIPETNGVGETIVINVVPDQQVSNPVPGASEERNPDDYRERQLREECLVKKSQLYDLKIEYYKLVVENLKKKVPKN